MIDKNPKDSKPHEELDRIVAECKKSNKYIVFAAQVTEDKNRDGNFIVNFQHIREKYPAEDLRKAVRAFAQMVERILD